MHESERFNYSEIYRPPGIVKIKDSRDLDEHGSSKQVDQAYRSASKPNQFLNRDMPNFEKYLVAEKEKEYRERCEKYIWSCVPDKKLFHREDYQSKYMVDIAAKKAEKWEHASQSLNQLLKQNGGSATVDESRKEAPVQK